MILQHSVVRALSLTILTVFACVLFFRCTSAEIAPPVDPPIAVDPCLLKKKQTIVILGSSIAQGVGASKYDSSWAGRLTAYARECTVINLARGGYITAQILPDSTLNPQIDRNVNIDAALKRSPTCVIISMTTNDIAKGVSVPELMANIKTTVDYARRKNVKHILVATPFPRSIDAASTAKFVAYRDEVLKIYGIDAIDFFNPVADAGNLPRAEYLSGDKLHPNDYGHKALFRALMTALNRQNCD